MSDNRALNDGMVVGGPMDGKRMTGSTIKILVPVDIPGEPGIGQAEYEFRFGMWVYRKYDAAP